MPIIKIDGKDYDTDQLSDDAKKQLGMINMIDRKLAELQREAAVYQTARNSYGKVLTELLESGVVEQETAGDEK